MSTVRESLLNSVLAIVSNESWHEPELKLIESPECVQHAKNILALKIVPDAALHILCAHYNITCTDNIEELQYDIDAADDLNILCAYRHLSPSYNHDNRLAEFLHAVKRNMHNPPPLDTIHVKNICALEHISYMCISIASDISDCPDDCDSTPSAVFKRLKECTLQDAVDVYESEELKKTLQAMFTAPSAEKRALVLTQDLFCLTDCMQHDCPDMMSHTMHDIYKYMKSWTHKEIMQLARLADSTCPVDQLHDDYAASPCPLARLCMNMVPAYNELDNKVYEYVSNYVLAHQS